MRDSDRFIITVLAVVFIYALFNLEANLDVNVNQCGCVQDEKQDNRYE